MKTSTVVLSTAHLWRQMESSWHMDAYVVAWTDHVPGAHGHGH